MRASLFLVFFLALMLNAAAPPAREVGADASPAELSLENIELISYTPGSFGPIAVQADFAYVVAPGLLGMNQVLMMDVSNPENPTQVASIELEGTIEEMRIAGDYVYLLENKRFAVLDVSVPKEPVEIGSLALENFSDPFDLGNGYAYIPWYKSPDFNVYTGGLYIVDISDPAGPALAGSYDYPDHWAHEVALAGQYGYVIGSRCIDLLMCFFSAYEMQVISLADPATPVLVKTLQYAGKDLTVKNDLLFTTHNNDCRPGCWGEMAIYDISDRTEPRWINSIDTPELTSATAIAVEGAFAYMGYVHNSEGAMAIDISKPHSPVEVGRLEGMMMREFPFAHVATQNGYVYWVAIWDGLYIFRHAVSATVIPEGETSLVFSDPLGTTSSLQAPAGAAPVGTTLYLGPLPGLSPLSGFGLIGHVLELSAQREDARQVGMRFRAPVTWTITYEEEQLRTITDEDEIGLYWWDGELWAPAGETCTPAAMPDHDPANNLLTVQVCATGRYALLGSTSQVFLPFLQN